MGEIKWIKNITFLPQAPATTYRVEYEPSRGSWLLSGRHPRHLKTTHPKSNYLATYKK